MDWIEIKKPEDVQVGDILIHGHLDNPSLQGWVTRIETDENDSLTIYYCTATGVELWEHDAQEQLHFIILSVGDVDRWETLYTDTLQELDVMLNSDLNHPKIQAVCYVMVSKYTGKGFLTVYLPNGTKDEGWVQQAKTLVLRPIFEYTCPDCKQDIVDDICACNAPTHDDDSTCGVRGLTNLSMNDDDHNVHLHLPDPHKHDDDSNYRAGYSSASGVHN